MTRILAPKAESIQLLAPEGAPASFQVVFGSDLGKIELLQLAQWMIDNCNRFPQCYSSPRSFTVGVGPNRHERYDSLRRFVRPRVPMTGSVHRSKAASPNMQFLISLIGDNKPELVKKATDSFTDSLGLTAYPVVDLVQRTILITFDSPTYPEWPEICKQAGIMI